MSLLNFNPPPLATPDTAHPARAPAKSDDDTISADVFAQLVAAAAMPNAVAAATNAPPPAHGEPTAAARVDGKSIGAALIAAIPGASASTGESRAAAVAPSDAATHAALDAANAATLHDDTKIAPTAALVDAFAASVAQRAAKTTAEATAAPSLRDQLAAALASHGAPATTSTPPNAPTAMATTAADNDATRERHRPSPAIMPAIATAMPAAIESAAAPAHRNETRTATLDAATLVAPPAPPRDVAPPAAVAIHTVVGAPGFGDEVASKLAHVVLRNDRAELRVSPPELGPVEIRIDVKSDAASLTIVAAHPATRDALEQALPQLRDALAAQGIALGHASVHDGRAQADARAPNTPPGSARASEVADPTKPIAATARAPLSNRLVDTYV